MELIKELPEVFEEFAEQRKNSFLGVKKLKEQGVPIVGAYCTYFPQEIAMAMGAATVGLCSTSDETIPEAERDLPKNLCPLIKSSYGFAKTDKCPFFYFSDVVVGETTCDGKKKMYEYMSEFKDVFLMELPNTQGEEALKLWKSEIIRFKEYLEKKFDVTITEDDIREAIKVNNAGRRSLRKLYEVMKHDPVPICGHDLFKVLYGSTFKFDRREIPAEVDALVEKIQKEYAEGKMLEKMEVLDKPAGEDPQMHFTLTPRVISGNDVLTVRELSKAFPGQQLFSDINFEIKRGERVAIIGANGTGKTTILKILNGLIPPDTGEVALGTKVQIGYYDQEHHVLHMDKTIFEEISDAYPYLTNTEIRNVLAAFLFTGDDVFQPISTLSGGERGRVSLAKLMLSEANFLILDEPTNHLDIVSKEILENALNRYEGTVLYVSHDRYFINQTATRILELTNQSMVNYIGNYDYYLEKKEELTEIYAPTAEAAAAEGGDSSSKQDWKARKEEQARQRKKENDLKKTEKQIEELETRDKEIDEEMNRPEVATDAAMCVQLASEKAEIALKLEELYEAWEELAQ